MFYVINKKIINCLGLILNKKNHSYSEKYIVKHLTKSVTQHTVKNFQFIKGFPPSNTWIIHSENDAILVDSGFGDRTSLFSLKNYINNYLTNIKIHYILLTHNHSDHSSGSRQLSEMFNAKVLIHKQEKKMLKTKSDNEDTPVRFRKKRQKWEDEKVQTPISKYIEHGYKIYAGNLQVEAVHTPGHTLGSICYLFRNEKILFSGDTILGYDTVSISAPPHGDMNLYLSSLKKLKKYKLKYIAPGHGDAITDPKKKINRLILHRLDREKQIIDLIGEGHRLDSDLLDAIYPNLQKGLKNSALNQIRSHLHRLKVLNKIQLKIDQDKWKVI